MGADSSENLYKKKWKLFFEIKEYKSHVRTKRIRSPNKVTLGYREENVSDMEISEITKAFKQNSRTATCLLTL